MRTAAEERAPLLPEGFHNLTIAQVRELCVSAPRFAKSPTRAKLMHNLEALVRRLVDKKIEGELWVDGSFLTEAIDPKDVDLSLRISGLFYDAATTEQVDVMDSVTTLYDTDRIDGYLQFEWPLGDQFYAVGQKNFAAWKKQWGRSRSGIAKGIAVVKLPKVNP